MTTTSGGAPPAAGEPGWFPDPWGTEKLRWWDGQACTPHLYPPANTGSTTTGPNTAGPPITGPASSAPPEGPARARWATEGLTSAPMPGSGIAPPAVAAERVAGHRARLALLWAGPLQALYDVGVAVQAGWYADHFDEL